LMLRELRVSGYRSLRQIALEVSPLTVVVGANGRPDRPEEAAELVAFSRLITGDAASDFNFDREIARGTAALPAGGTPASGSDDATLGLNAR
jgi:hypothetical protein